MLPFKTVKRRRSTIRTATPLLLAIPGRAKSMGSALLLLALIVPLIFCTTTTADTAADLTECGTALVGMQTCITYVQGAAKTPTPDCCTGLKDVLARSPKCLCVLVKDHDDPQLPIKINVTRALALPDACATAANISACPKLLNLPPNSKEAQIFKQTASGSTTEAKGNSSATTASTTSSKPNSVSTSSGSSIHHGWKGKGEGVGWLERKMVVGFLLLFALHLLHVST